MTFNRVRQRSKSTTRNRLLSTAVIPAVLGVGVAVGGVVAQAGPEVSSAERAQSQSLLPMAQPKPAAMQLAFAAQCNPCNPCAAKKGCNPCNPCAAKMGCNPCNPCAAKMGCNPCNPCAAKKGCNPCNPCNPCAGGGMAMTDCFVPRLQTASANPCNPCAAKKGCGPCNPCAAKKMGCNPCNPCAAKKMGCGPCNPCAAKKMGCNPCNPCAAKTGCNPCNPCNPCGAGASAQVNPCEAANAYKCAKDALKAAYQTAGLSSYDDYQDWAVFNKAPYQSATHGNRYVNNFVNARGAEAYGEFENIDEMPAGSLLAKDSFSVNANGQIGVGPFFLMEKMRSGFNADTGDWKYTMVMPNGQVMGVTNGQGSANVQFCADCHVAVAGMQDSLYFVPQNMRKN